MAILTKRALEELLTRRARLKAPRFRLRFAENKLVGAVISDSFKGMTNYERMRRMRDAVDGALDEGNARRVGLLLPYTDDEWDEPVAGLPSPRSTRPRPARKAG